MFFSKLTRPGLRVAVHAVDANCAKCGKQFTRVEELRNMFAEVVLLFDRTPIVPRRRGRSTTPWRSASNHGS